MKNYMILIITIFFLISCKNPQSPELWGEEFDSIRFRIWTDKSTYNEGEDIWLFVEFENVGSEARVILISPKQQLVTLYDIKKIIISTRENRSDSSSVFEIVPLHSNMLFTEPNLLKLESGQKYNEKTLLTLGFWNRYHERYKHDPFTYLEPGKYSLQAVYTWDELPYPTSERKEQLEQLGAPLWTGYLESNVITIKVSSK